MSHPLEQAVYVYSTDGCQGGWLQDAALSSLLHRHGLDGGAAAAKGHGHQTETMERMAGAELSQATAKAEICMTTHESCFRHVVTISFYVSTHLALLTAVRSRAHR